MAGKVKYGASSELIQLESRVGTATVLVWKDSRINPETGRSELVFKVPTYLGLFVFPDNNLARRKAMDTLRDIQLTVDRF